MEYNRRMCPAEEPQVWSVSQITRRVKNALEDVIGHVWVSGEISNFRVSPAGHSYFTLKDEKSQMASVMFKGRLSRLRFEPENGLEVIVHGQVTVYEQRGAYQIICEDMQPKGMGALQLAFEKLRRKLEEEGLFDEEHKKPMPMLPKRIGIVTSPTGAAIRDILNVIGRRFANVHVILFPARVQGDEAAAEIAEGIQTLDAWGVDAMIVGRGGGSLEDLWPFNEEVVVRAVYNAQTPIISAVGHEIDFTLCDFAADMRAPTPSAAAEIVVQEHETLVASIDILRTRLAGAMGHVAERFRARLEHAQGSYMFRRPEELIRQRRQRSDELRLNLEQSVRARFDESKRGAEAATRALRLLSPARQIQQAMQGLLTLRPRLLQSGRGVLQHSRARFQTAVAQLDALSPLSILSRGYALTWKLPGDELVRDSAQLNTNDSLRLKFGRGEARAVITEIKEELDSE